MVDNAQTMNRQVGVHLVFSMYKGVRSRVRVGGEYSKEFDVLSQKWMCSSGLCTEPASLNHYIGAAVRR